jgi:hypothetical protein
MLAAKESLEMELRLENLRLNRVVESVTDILFPMEQTLQCGTIVDHSVDGNLEAAIFDLSAGGEGSVDACLVTLRYVLERLLEARVTLGR